MRQLGPWPFRVVWTTLPLTAGPLFAAALDATDTPYRTVVSVALWVVWAAVTIVMFVPRTETLTAIRVVATTATPAALWALAALTQTDGGVLDPAWTDAGWIEAGGAVACILATFTVLLAEFGQYFVDGSSYGDETRMPLRVPAALLIGPLELAWVAAVAGVAAPVLLLADQRWVIGAIALVVGLPIAAVAIRSLHALSQRFLVFVPAGMVLHDRMALSEPALFRRAEIRSLGAAPADSRALDLTLGSPGLLLEVGLTNPIEVGVLTRSRTATSDADLLPIAGFLVAATRPGAVVTEARRRSIGDQPASPPPTT